MKAESGLAAPQQTDEDRSRDEALERLLEEGIELIHSGDFEAAIARLDRIISDHDVQYGGVLGQRHVASVSLEEFMAFFQSREHDQTPVVWINPCYAQAHYYKAYALIQKDRLSDAATELESAIELNPMHASYYLELAYIHARQRVFDTALQLYNQATKVDYSPGHASTAAAYRGIGYVYTESGLLAEAAKMYERSLELDPDSPIAKNELEYIDGLRRMGYREAKTQ